MDIIIFLIVGLIAGWLAGVVMKRSYGLVGNLAIGVVGAIIGGYLFSWLGINLGIGGLAGSIIVAFIGAIILIFILGLIRR
ncbi:MAG TPA: GlsB/YeaQ/YmgE family stress response membrane protein [Anaerolineae bacterium]|nr:GlsB/YeaQ/YmgE family stress response membrane protein [Anaerolineae bacterium]MCB0177679.1 GlsB/YeaQ/YmgE family stress response membrane protein [Anaerolineae bacterium]MCB0224498.1 GlsB/YeaQ/YmgE family stress response membrane protein [Anaerolineae bacterium]MCB9105361.1 GlsB/YeaQ/YmgE family stress response membrane protein [Anaerolineales bacterium]HRV93383.1 GlsB/YeaQ/YmgE family stress response membrane protein [Anaerolineae bacterium]